MQLYTVCPNPDESYHAFKPKKGISLKVERNVPCLTYCCYAWVIDALEGRGIDPSFQILPVVLTESTKQELRARKEKKLHPWDPWDDNHLFIKYASLQKQNSSVFFLKEEESSEDLDVLVSLELPLSAAQPYYEFAGDAEVILGAYATYYGERNGSYYEVEKENALCSAIVRIGNGTKVSFTYTNRYCQGIAIKRLLGQKFELICRNGQLFRADDFEFYDRFSDFVMDDEKMSIEKINDEELGDEE